MPKSVTRRDLRDDEILRFLRFSVTESAAATFTEVSYDTQLSIDRGLIWLIHFVEIFINPANLDDAAAGGNEMLLVQISRESQAAAMNINDADCVFLQQLQMTRSAAIGTDAGPMYWYDMCTSKFDYMPPLAFAAQNIYIGAQGSAAAAKSVYGRIGYTLRRVSDKFFYRVAQALIS